MHSDAEMVGRRLLERAGIEPGGGRPWDPVIHDPRFWARVLRHRELGLGESYQDGWWDVPALDELMVRLLRADLQGQIRTSPKLGLLLARSLLWNRQSVRGASRNARSHYNTGNDLFARMLDARMVYSCAYWDGQTDLEAAQEAKLELICRKLHLQPGMTMLDIGCGWGGLAVHAARHHGVHVTGISPAAEQLKVATERGAGLPVRFLQQDYRRHTGRYDRVVSVGMFEHVGPRNHRDFFRTCDRLLTPDGLMLHHTIHGLRPRRHADPWIDRYIFPGGVLPSPSQITRAVEPDWMVEDVHEFGPDYDRTLMAWHDNVEAAWDDLPAYDERFRRTWRYYLLSCAAAFRVRHIGLLQAVFRRALRPLPTYAGVRDATPVHHLASGN